MDTKKAAKFYNKSMMLIGAFALVLILVFGVIYFSYKDRTYVNDLYTIHFTETTGRNVQITVNDSLVFDGVSNDSIVVHAPGDTKHNILSIHDLQTNDTQKFITPNTPSNLSISYNGTYQVKAAERSKGK